MGGHQRGNAVLRRHQAFLQENEDVGLHLRSKLLSFFDNLQITSQLWVEIAVTVDWREPFMKLCYTTEGDGPLSLECYEIIDKVKAAVVIENIPNERASM